VLGTRGSELARAQATLVEGALRVAWPELEIVIEVIKTRGDEKSGDNEPVTDRHAGRKGLFTSEIEHALLEQRIDVAVHSAKDLPSDPTVGLELSAALPRAPVEDVLIAKHAVDFSSLPTDATIGTGSVRREHQLRWLRPDLKIVDLRGNVPTRLRKLIDNEWEGIVLARAGLERVGHKFSAGVLLFEGIELRSAVLKTDDFLPAGGQGIVALQSRTDDARTRIFLAVINHAETLICLRAEREFLRLLQGDCGTPVGVRAELRGAELTMRAQLFGEGRAEPRTATTRKDARQEPESLAAELLELING